MNEKTKLMKLHIPSKQIVTPMRRLLRAVDKVRKSERSAGFQPGFQPAVSPISNRQSVASPDAAENSALSQAGSTAIQQVGNLRYDFIHSPRVPRAPGPRN